MTNSYYNKGGTYSRGTTARAETVESDLAAVEDGFDLLPAPTAVHGDSFNYSTDTGTANAYAVTVSGGPASPTAGTTVKFFAANANTAASTLTYTGSSAWSAKGLRRNNGDALVSGDIRAGQLVEATYNGSYFAINAVAYGEISDAIAAGESIGPSLTDIQTLADIEDGTVATNAISGLAAISSDVTAVSGITVAVSNVSSISADVTGVNSIAANVTTVAGDSADIQALAAITADITGVNAISADVTTVAADATDIGTVSTNIASVNTCATNIADIQDAATLVNGLTAADIANVAAGGIVATDVQAAINELDGEKVTGPAGATDNALVQFDGTTGKLAKNGPSIGTSANNLVQLDGSARLPAVDGSLLTNLNTGGLTQISQTVISSPVATVEFTSIPDTYDHLYFVIEDVSHNGGSARSMAVRISNDNGSTYSAAGTIGPAENAADEYNGGGFIFGYNKNAGVCVINVHDDTTGLRIEAGSSLIQSTWRATGGIDAVRFELNADSFDAGTITLYGY